MTEQWRQRMFWSNYCAFRAHGVSLVEAARLARLATDKPKGRES